jgi:tetratricopeptide (TPR) repeat protein
MKRLVDWDWMAANASLQRALALDPGNPAVLYDASTLAGSLGHFEEALELVRRSITLDPLNAALTLLRYHVLRLCLRKVVSMATPSPTTIPKPIGNILGPLDLVSRLAQGDSEDPTRDRVKSSGGMPSDASQPIQFAGSVLDAQRHVCAFFHNPDEEYRVLLPFIKDGFARGEKAFHIVDPKLRSEHRLRLASAGIDVETAETSGQFELRNWADAYLRDGHFDQDRMLALIEEVLDGGRQQGFARTRLVAHMEWALEDRPGVDDLVEYETRLNYVLPRYKDPVI